MCSMSVHYIIQKTLNTNKCTKGFFITCNTLLHVSTLLGLGLGLQAEITESSRLQMATQYTINS
jgi:hypothetical protein